MKIEKIFRFVVILIALSCASSKNRRSSIVSDDGNRKLTAFNLNDGKEDTEKNALSELSLPSLGNAAQAIDSAKNLEVKSKYFSLSRDFSVTSNGIQIALAKGTFLSIGLKYQLQDNSGNLLTKFEQKVLRLLSEFHFLTENGVEYLRLKQPFKLTIGQHLYYYDTNGKQIAYLDQNWTLFLKSYNIRNIDGTIIYKIQQRFSFIDAIYQIEKIGEGPITMKDAVLSTVIACLRAAAAANQQQQLNHN